MRLSKKLYQFYFDYFKGEYNNNLSFYLSHIDNLMQITKYKRPKLVRDLQSFFLDFSDLKKAESRKSDYDNLFFNLPYGDRPSVSELSRQMGLSETEVKYDLYNLGFNLKEYRKVQTQKKRKQCLLLKEQDSFVDLSEFGDIDVSYLSLVEQIMSEKLPNTNVSKKSVYKERYIRLLKYYSLYLLKPDNEKPSISVLSKLINCSSESIRRDFKQLGIYEEYLTVKRTQNIERVNQKSSSEREKKSCRQDTQALRVLKYFEEHSENKELHKSYIDISNDLDISTNSVNFYLQKFGYRVSKCLPSPKLRITSDVYAFCDMLRNMRDTDSLTLSDLELERKLNCRMGTIRNVLKSEGLYEKFKNLRNIKRVY